MENSKNIVAPFAQVLGKREAKVDGLNNDPYTYEEMALLEQWDSAVRFRYNLALKQDLKNESKNEADEYTDSLFENI